MSETFLNRFRNQKNGQTKKSSVLSSDDKSLRQIFLISEVEEKDE